MGFRFLAFGWGTSSLAFLVRWVSQLCAFLWEGRQNFFNCSLLSNHVEVIFFNLIVIFFIVLFLVIFWSSNGFELLITFGHYCEYCVLCDEDFLLFFLFFCSSVSGVYLSLYVSFLLIGCAGSVGISLASRVMYILCVCFRCVECRAGTIYLGTSVVWAAELYGFPFLSGSAVAGTVR